MNAAVNELKKEVASSEEIASTLRIYVYLPLVFFWAATVYFSYKIFSESFSYDQLMLELDATVFKRLETNCSTFLYHLKEQYPISTKSNLKTEESESNEEGIMNHSMGV